MERVVSPLLLKAISFASEVHLGQKRKGKETPYIEHPLAVALILSQVTRNESTIAAGILHDTIEDCDPYGSVTVQILEKEFNSDVARDVNDVTEQDKSLSWDERKQMALNHIKDMRESSRLVKSADVLHNLSELNNDIFLVGEKVWDRFSVSQEKTVLRYQKLYDELYRVWAGNPLLLDFSIELKRLYGLIDEQ